MKFECMFVVKSSSLCCNTVRERLNIRDLYVLKLSSVLMLSRGQVVFFDSV